ncbi:response regulator [Pseudomonas costantinii]|uniref:response regulator n=1 Tax=Pseudomonas costantinii TaxID=168469 RepID=UPI0015A24BF8|nr:response regulator [Pseudomonas costantinii]NVZ69579.1 response regulator transcription factor [Pseudomonas costantinii]
MDKTEQRAQVAETQMLVLIADVDPKITDILTTYLKRAGFRTAHAIDGSRALEMHRTLKPALVLLDVLIPKLDGWMVLTEVRNRGNTPVIMFTAQDQEMEKLLGLRIGADDCIVKPFNPDEVVARIQAVLRRYIDHGNINGQSIIRVGAFEVNVKNHEVIVRTNGIKSHLALTVTEFRLLAQLAKVPKKVYSRTELLSNCCPESECLERTVDSHMSKLRKKIEGLGIRGVPFSIRGVGYRLGRACETTE